MSNKIRYFYRNISLKYKILIGILLISTACLILISASCYKYLSDTYEQDTYENAEYALDIGASDFKEEVESVILNANKFISISRVCNIIESFSNPKDMKEYVKHYNYIQTPLKSYIRTNSYIDTIVLIGENGDFYGVSDIGWNHKREDLFENDDQEAEGIRMLPAQINPLTKLNTVIPLVIPITTLEKNRPIISGSIEEATGNLVIYLNSDKILNSLSKVNKSPDSIIYIANEAGESINLKAETFISKITDLNEFKDEISNVTTDYKFTYEMNYDSYIVMARDVGICNLKLVSITSKNQLLGRLNTIQLFIVSIWGICTALSIFLSLLISHFITRKIGKLTKDVQNIERGCYQVKDSNSLDEVGQLRDSINSMYLTIQAQIGKIKREEEERTKAEINILSEQINPHFLYNTLDCINWEILSGEKEMASNMIGSLSDFLRIGLSHGAQTITFKEEIAHAENYLYIMNQRSELNIKFICCIDKQLEQYRIVKLILQPLVENAIKHGFTNVDFTAMGIVPTIELNIKQEVNHINILVCDNGAGIDISKAKQLLNAVTSQDTNHHVGLNNIYRRLCSVYGQAEFEFYTTPFFKNIVKIVIPIKIKER